jgi:hypothetical protein
MRARWLLLAVFLFPALAQAQTQRAHGFVSQENSASRAVLLTTSCLDDGPDGVCDVAGRTDIIVANDFSRYVYVGDCENITVTTSGTSATAETDINVFGCEKPEPVGTFSTLTPATTATCSNVNILFGAPVVTNTPGAVSNFAIGWVALQFVCTGGCDNAVVHLRCNGKPTD